MFTGIFIILVPFYLLVHEKVLRGSDDFVWQVDSMFHERFTVDVEFLDLKIASININYVHLCLTFFFSIILNST
jgi:hypothetical protein